MRTLVSRHALALATPLAIALVIAVAATATPRPGPVTSAAPSWTTFAELAHPRAYGEAIVLPDGEILVVGGLDRDDPHVTNTESELVNLKTGAVTVLKHQLVGRLHQTMTRAQDDRVVVSGGVVFKTTHWDPVDTVDVYLPHDKMWVSASPLIDARSDHAATAMLDGKVIVTGGNQGPRLLQSVEIYDVKNDRWFRATPMPAPRTAHSAFTLRDGRVLVAGGIGADGAPTDITFIYDPPKDTWTEGPRMVFARILHAAVPLANGDILFAGGDAAASGTSERYIAELGRFVQSGTLVEPRHAGRAAALPDGRVVLVGGMPPRTDEFAPLRSAEIWDPATQLWSALPPSPTPRAWPSIVMSGGLVYQLSGTGDAETAYRTIERLALN